jgi:uncharacterized membrane protein
LRAELAKLQKEYLIEMDDVVVTKNDKGKVLEELKGFMGGFSAHRGYLGLLPWVILAGFVGNFIQNSASLIFLRQTVTDIGLRWCLSLPAPA